MGAWFSDGHSLKLYWIIHIFMEYKTIYQKIKQLRLKRKITIQDLSAKTGLTPGYLSKIENSQ
ncbi:hypothetical protein D1BOALGB6SA_6708, partial [Olavius sp. associated proteobacterium Delta 1]